MKVKTARLKPAQTAPAIICINKIIKIFPLASIQGRGKRQTSGVVNLSTATLPNLSMFFPQ